MRTLRCPKMSPIRAVRLTEITLPIISALRTQPISEPVRPDSVAITPMSGARIPYWISSVMPLSRSREIIGVLRLARGSTDVACVIFDHLLFDAQQPLGVFLTADNSAQDRRSRGSSLVR